MIPDSDNAPDSGNAPDRAAAVLGKSNAPIFIVGHPRSGTTLLRLILNAHPRIVIPPEAHLVSYLRRVERKFGAMSVEANRRAAAERLVDKHRQKEWELGREETMAAVMGADPQSPAGMLDAVMQLWCARAGKPRWGEKTPGTYRFLPEVAAWFPDCQVIHIVRDGRDVAVSCLTPPFSDNYDKGNVYEVALRWRDAVRRCREAEAAMGPGRFLQIRYEDLAGDAETVVRRVVSFLGEAFDPAMLEYHRSAPKHVARGDATFHGRTRQEVNKGRVERWRKDASEAFVCGFEGVAGPELEELGYAPSGLRPGAGLRLRIGFEKLRPRNLTKNYKPRGGSASRIHRDPG